MRALLNQNKARKVEIKEKRQQDVDVVRYDVFGDSDDEEDDQMTTARRESFMTHQEEQERRWRTSSGRSSHNEAGGSSSVPSKGKGIAGPETMRRAFSTHQ